MTKTDQNARQKLTLRRETLQTLTPTELCFVVGGARGRQTIARTVTSGC